VNEVWKLFCVFNGIVSLANFLSLSILYVKKIITVLSVETREEAVMVISIFLSIDFVSDCDVSSCRFSSFNYPKQTIIATLRNLFLIKFH